FDMEYADKADNWAPIFSASAGDTWDLDEAGTFGAMVMLSYQDRRLRRDSFATSLFVYDHTEIEGLDEPAKNTPSGKYVVPTEHKFEPFTEDRERTAYNVSLQWAPASGAGNFYVDLNSTERDGGQEAYSILHVSGTPVATADTYEDANGALNNYRMESNVVAIPKTWSSFRSTDSFSNAIGGEWNFTDNLKVSGEFSHAKSDSTVPNSEFNWRAIDPDLEAADPSQANAWYSDVTIINSQSKAPGVVYDAGEIYTQSEHFALREYRHIDERIKNEETAYRVDVEYTEPMGWEWLTSVKTGLRFTENEYERSRSELRLADMHSKLFDDNGDPTIIWMNDIANAFPGAIITPDVGGDAFEHSGFVGTNHIRNFTVYDAKRLQNADQTFNMLQQLLAGTNYAREGSLADNLVESKGSYALINEDTSAFYLQANMDFGRWRAITGGRYIETEITSTAYNQAGTDFVVESQKYNDFLPSLNITYD